MKIVFKDFVIRNVIRLDVKNLFLWWNDGLIMAHAGFPNGLGVSLEEIKFQIENMPNSKTKWLMIEKNHIPIGEMNYRQYVDYTEIGIKICDFSFHHKGYGKVFLSMFISFLFKQNCKKIVVMPNFCNSKARSVYEQLGFQKIKVHEHCWQNPLGEWQSAVEYHLNKENFKNYAV